MKPIEKIISENHHDEFPATPGRPSISPSPLRLTSEHFQNDIPATEKKSNSMRQWNFCHGRITLSTRDRNSRATRGLLATNHVILNHGQETWTTPELAPRRVFSGTGLELMTYLPWSDTLTPGLPQPTQVRNKHNEDGPRVTRTPNMEQNVLDTVWKCIGIRAPAYV
ncbi:hypothetical protein TNCV_1303061 [Trichonephila clavipes]|nr:hypothetical protein TNCV_1303061 [Trichonephila clavipes]